MSRPPHLRDTTASVKIPWGRVILLVVVLSVFIVARNSLRVIPAGHRGVLYNMVRRGVQNTVLREGIVWVNPVTTRVVLIDVRSQTYTMSNSETEGSVQSRGGIEAKTKDGQIVNLDISVRYHLEPTKLPQLYRTLGLDYETKFVLPTLRSKVRNVFAGYPVDAVYSEAREDIAAGITQELNEAFEPRGLVLDGFLLRNITFTPEYAAAIEAKQIEQQNALRKEYELQLARKEAERRRIEAEGEARANDIRGGALRANPRVVQYDYVRKLAPRVRALVVDQDDLRRGVVSLPPTAGN